MNIGIFLIFDGGGGNIEYNGKKYSVYSPEKLREIEFDYIFIAAAEQYICEILKVLKKLI